MIDHIGVIDHLATSLLHSGTFIVSKDKNDLAFVFIYNVLTSKVRPPHNPAKMQSGLQ